MTTAPVPALESLLALMVIAAITDLRTRKIPNWLVATGLLLALTAQILQSGPLDGATMWWKGALTGFVPFVFLYLVNAIGAGDAKLMAAIGGFVGPLGALHIMVLTFLAGGVLAVVITVLHGSHRLALARLSNLILSLPFGLRFERPETDPAQRGARLPYAVAMASAVGLFATGTL